MLDNFLLIFEHVTLLKRLVRLLLQSWSHPSALLCLSACLRASPTAASWIHLMGLED